MEVANFLFAETGSGRLAGLVAGPLWCWPFKTDIPSHLSGVVGLVSAVPLWTLLKRTEIRREPTAAGIRKVETPWRCA
jgi:hypothetical protein